jgi:hypothetical protein
MGDPEYQARFGMKLLPQVIRSQLDLIEEAEWEVEEYIEIVVSTDAMPPEQWRRAKVFAWMVDFAHFNRALQIPLLIFSKRYGWPVHELIEAMMDADPERYPVTAGLVQALDEKAVSIQNAGPEYFPIPEANALLWTGGLRCLISLVLDDNVDAFYAEIGELFGAMLTAGGHEDDLILLDETLTLNQAALTLPFQPANKLLVLSHNVWEHYQSLLIDDPVPLDEGFFFHRIAAKRQVWDSIEGWAEHLAEAEGQDKRRYLQPTFAPREWKMPVAAVPAG